MCLLKKYQFVSKNHPTKQIWNFKIFYEFIKKIKGIGKNSKGYEYRYYNFNGMAIEAKSVYW